jgi:hypothetical protein
MVLLFNTLWHNLKFYWQQNILRFLTTMYRVIKKSLCTWRLQYSTIDDMKMAVTEYIRSVDRAILNTVLENTVRCVNECSETGGGHFEYYL